MTRDLTDTDILTISVAYAEAHAADPDGLRASGLSPLFDKLTQLTQSQGVAIKRQTPLNNLRAFVDKVLTGDPDLSVKVVRADLASLETQIWLQCARLQERLPGVMSAPLEPDFLIPIERRLRDIHAALDRFERVLTQEVRPQ